MRMILWKTPLKVYSNLKDSAKDDLLRSLRGVLFERKVVTRKDKSEDVITVNNLRTVI